MKKLHLLSIVACCYGISIRPIFAQGFWMQKTSYPGTACSSAVAFSIPLPLGKCYICTGYGTNESWEYNPGTDTWTQKSAFGGVGRRGAVGCSIDTIGYVGLGMSSSFSNLNDFWQYNPTTDTWTQLANFGGGTRAWAVCFPLGKKVYVGTGSGIGDNNAFWEFDTQTNNWVQKNNFGGIARYDAVGFSILDSIGRGYIGTGYDNTNFCKDFWEYNPVNDSWTQKADFGGIARKSAVGFSIGSYGYIGTGLTDNNWVKDFWEYNPVNNTWLQKADFGGVGCEYGVGFSLGNKGYIGLGVTPSPTTQLWEYSPCTITLPTIASNGPTTFCQGDSVILTSTPYLSYQWSTGATTQSITVYTSGIYKVTVTNSNGCTAASSSVSVTVNPIPTASISANGNVLISSSATGNQWYLNGNIILGANSQYYTSFQNGIYIVTVTINGCSNTSAPYNYSGIGVDEYCERQFVSITPNPFSNHTTFEFSNPLNRNYQLKIFSNFGQMVREENTNEKVFILYRENLSPGIYFYTLTHKQEIIEKGKMVIE